MTTTLNILIVDDDQDVAEGLADVLGLSGHQITLAHSGQDAIELFSQQEFDIAFMDVKMPGMNGVESLVEIRKIKPNAKVAIMTGYSVQELLKEAVDNGAIGVLYKPVEATALLAALEIVSNKAA